MKTPDEACPCLRLRSGGTVRPMAVSSQDVPFEARVARVWPETDTLLGVYLEVEAPARQQHVRCGQIVVVEPDVYLALASVPKAPQFELLVAPAAVEALDLREGASLKFRGPVGPGFDLEPAVGKDVLLFAVGSALAPIKPVVEAIRLRRGEFARVSLYAGALSESALAYRGVYPAWERDRIDVTTVLDPSFVQDVFDADPQDLSDAVAYVCGMPAMMDGVTEVLGRHGLSSDLVFRNW